MDSHRSKTSVEILCRILELSRSGYYAWKTRRPSKRQQRNRVLLRRLVELHEKYPALGLDSLYHMLQPQFGCSRARVHRLMKQANLHSLRHNAYKGTTNSNHCYPTSPNLLQRQFSFVQPNQAWVSDITYVPTDEGWLYVAIVKDLCTKRVVGYAFSNHIDTALTLKALRVAEGREHPEPGLICHSDRGVQYAATLYRQELAQLGLRSSMSRKGDPYDNAVAENFFSCLKCELVHLTHFSSRSQAQVAIFAYIEAFYNSIRPHSALGWLTPNQFASRFAACAA